MTEAVNQSGLATSLPYRDWARTDLPADPGGFNPAAPLDSVQPAFTGVAAGPVAAGDGGSNGGFGIGNLLGGIGNGINSIVNGFGCVINNIMGEISNQLNALNGSSGTTPPQTPVAVPEQLVTQASLTDWGDPHLSASGTTDAGQTISGAWDNMDAHSDLLTSDSFDGGFQIATAVTDPNAQGVTLNSSADVYTQNGNVSVAMSGAGASITDNGQQIAMQTGQSYALGNDEVATENADGSVVIDQANASGGSILTTLSMNGAGGVDVNAQASEVDLGGYLLTHTDQPGAIG